LLLTAWRASFPNLFLRIEIQRSYREGHDFQTRIVRNYLPDGRPAMPGSSIPEQPDWFVWDGGKDL
jgi:hypothetical protein